MNCIHCGKETNAYPFRVLQVQTLHVRDLGGEKRVQSLGDFEDHVVCASCAEARYHSILEDKSSFLRSVLPFTLLGIAGVILTLLTWKVEPALRLLGLGMFICGILGTYSNARTAGAQKRELSQLTREEALRRCAWECFVASAPKKNDVNDITYIPIDETTLSRKNGDLMILYDLLPEIAVQAYERIHGSST